MLNYDEFNRLIREEVKNNSVGEIDDDKILVIYQSNALNVQKGVAFDGTKFYVVTHEANSTTTEIYEKRSL